MVTALLVVAAVVLFFGAFGRSSAPRHRRRRLREMSPAEHAQAVLNGVILFVRLSEEHRARLRCETPTDDSRVGTDDEEDEERTLE